MPAVACAYTHADSPLALEQVCSRWQTVHLTLRTPTAIELVHDDCSLALTLHRVSTEDCGCELAAADDDALLVAPHVHSQMSCAVQ